MSILDNDELNVAMISLQDEVSDLSKSLVAYHKIAANQAALWEEQEDTDSADSLEYLYEGEEETKEDPEYAEF